jgi:hypothetical protein
MIGCKSNDSQSITEPSSIPATTTLSDTPSVIDEIVTQLMNVSDVTVATSSPFTDHSRSLETMCTSVFPIEHTVTISPVESQIEMADTGPSCPSIVET